MQSGSSGSKYAGRHPVVQPDLSSTTSIRFDVCSRHGHRRGPCATGVRPAGRPPAALAAAHRAGATATCGSANCRHWLDAPQNLLSYHLRQLRDGGLVTARRSSYDGRDSYYHLDLDRCADGAGRDRRRPAPGAAEDTGAPTPRWAGGHAPSVLFVCTGNSVRSPIAEALVRHYCAENGPGDQRRHPPKARLHPNTVRVLREQFGIDVAGQRPRHARHRGRPPVRPRGHLVRQGSRGVPRAGRARTPGPLEHPRASHGDDPTGQLPRLLAGRGRDRHPRPASAAEPELSNTMKECPL